MRKLLLFVLICISANFLHAQTNGDMRYDSVRLFKSGGYTELVLRNRTRDTLGFLFNKGNGITEYRRAKQLNDSILVFGVDTFHLSGSGGGASLILQQTIDNGSVLDKDNTIDFAGNNMAFSNGSFDLRDITDFYLPWANFESSTVEGSVSYNNSSSRFRGRTFTGWDNFVMDRDTAGRIQSKPGAKKTTDSLATVINASLATKQATLVSGTNIKTINSTSLLGSGDITISGGSGSPGGTDEAIQVNKSSSFAGPSTLRYDTTNKKLKVFQTSNQDLTSMADYVAGFFGNIIHIGDTAGTFQPSFIEFTRGESTHTYDKIRWAVGPQGSTEFNFGNLNYRDLIHQSYDTTQNMVWHALGLLRQSLQAVGKGHSNYMPDRVTRRDQYNAFGKNIGGINYLLNGNDIVGGTVFTNGLDIWDYTTTDIEQISGTRARFGVASATLTIDQIPQVDIRAPTNVASGGAPLFTGNTFGISQYDDITKLGMYNFDNNSNGIYIYGEKKKGSSHVLTNGTIMQGLDATHVGKLYFVASSDAPGSFTSPDLRLYLQDASGIMTETFTALHTGNIGINQATPTVILDINNTGAIRLPVGTTAQRPTASNGLARMNSDSIGIAMFEISDGTGWFSPSSSGGGGGGGAQNFNSVLTQGGAFTADRSARINDKNFTINQTTGIVAISGSSPRLDLIDSVNSITGTIKVSGGYFDIGGATGTVIKTSKRVVAMDNSNQNVDYGYNLGAIRAITNNPNTLTSPFLFWADDAAHTSTHSFDILSAQSGSNALIVDYYGKVGLNGVSSPSAWLHIGAGSATAGTAPLKFTSGTPTTTPEAGSVQYNNGLYIIDSSSSQRDTVATRKILRQYVADNSDRQFTRTLNTTNSTVTTIDSVNSPTNTVTEYEVTITSQSGSDAAVYRWRIGVKNISDVNTIVGGSAIFIADSEDAGLSGASTSVSTTGNYVIFRVTGITATSIDWKITYKEIAHQDLIF